MHKIEIELSYITKSDIDLSSVAFDVSSGKTTHILISNLIIWCIRIINGVIMEILAKFTDLAENHGVSFNWVATFLSDSQNIEFYLETRLA